MLEFIMPQGTTKNHDPLGLILKHYVIVVVQWPYLHQTLQEERRYQNVDSLANVFPINKTSLAEVFWDSTRLSPEETQQEIEVSKTPLQIAEERIVK